MVNSIYILFLVRCIVELFFSTLFIFLVSVIGLENFHDIVHDDVLFT